LSSNPDVKSITQRFFAAYDAHDVDGMLALCADGAQERYLPYDKNSVMPVRAGLEKIWRGFPKAVPDFGAEIIEMIRGEENTIVVQALLGGTMPADVAGLVRKGEVGSIAHAYIIRYNRDGKISRLDCYWDNTAINAIKASAL
jgi:ketosteroid isomerase-like protein